MKNRGILVSRKGRGGGYALARPSSQVSFGEIVRMMDGPLAPVPCVSATAYHRCEECVSEESCEIRGVMQRDARRDQPRGRAASCGVLTLRIGRGIFICIFPEAALSFPLAKRTQLACTLRERGDS